MRVAGVERARPGGVCLNWGCIPSKALLDSAETLESIRGAGKEHGIEVGEVRVDFKRVIARSPAAPALEAERILIATGSGERLLPGMSLGDGLMTSKEALLHDQLPESVIV